VEDLDDVVADDIEYAVDDDFQDQLDELIGKFQERWWDLTAGQASCDAQLLTLLRSRKEVR
jgi:hypothetical protein